MTRLLSADQRNMRRRLQVQPNFDERRFVRLPQPDVPLYRSTRVHRVVRTTVSYLGTSSICRSRQMGGYRATVIRAMAVAQAIMVTPTVDYTLRAALQAAAV